MSAAVATISIRPYFLNHSFILPLVNARTPTLKNSIQKLRQRKNEQRKFSVVAAYDASFTTAINQANIEVILVGDSLGMVVQGKESTVPVTIEQMVYHTEAVARGNASSHSQALIIADMPFMSYATTEDALFNAAKLMRAGANMVKLEGGAWLAETTAKLVECGIPVCAHIGLTPQSVNKLGGYKVQGRSDNQQQQLLNDAKALDDAGADFIVLECIPKSLAADITHKTGFSTIGIGAGNDTDAQVLVCYDLLGLTSTPAKFVKNFLADDSASQAPSIVNALSAYKKAVEDNSYPAQEHEYQ